MHVSPDDNNYAFTLRDPIENDFQGVLFFKNPIDSIIFENLLSVKDNKPYSPQQFKLNQNFPNPFNSGTVIKYSISKPYLVELKIYNILGKEINSLINEYKTAGEYDIH